MGLHPHPGSLLFNFHLSVLTIAFLLIVVDGLDVSVLFCGMVNLPGVEAYLMRFPSKIPLRLSGAGIFRFPFYRGRKTMFCLGLMGIVSFNFSSPRLFSRWIVLLVQFFVCYKTCGSIAPVNGGLPLLEWGLHLFIGFLKPFHPTGGLLFSSFAFSLSDMCAAVWGSPPGIPG